MAQFKINDGSSTAHPDFIRTVEADSFQEDGDFVVFYRNFGDGVDSVAFAIKKSQVQTVERAED